MISVSKLSVEAGDFAINDVSFSVAGGAYAALMGRTGSGKTTILECLCGLRSVRGGTIHFGSTDVTKFAPAERGIGYVPQDGALFETMTVWANLSFALDIRQWDSEQIEKRLDELVELLGLGDLLQRKPAKLSGGEKQRVALGRALAFRPSILCLDEPLSALDDATRADMYQLLNEVKKTGVTTLHVTHSREEAIALADVVLKLNDGSVNEVLPAEL